MEILPVSLRVTCRRSVTPVSHCLLEKRSMSIVARAKTLATQHWRAYEERERPSSPRWMTQVLWVAGIYNLLWGAFVVLFPLAPFRWAGMALPNYPEIWQCVGMIVGVYGVGYIIAAHHPFRHWPIVLVGFLGKVFGPFGMAWSLYKGTLPKVAAWTCATNDLIWWGPFGLILWGAYANFWRQRGHRS